MNEVDLKVAGPFDHLPIKDLIVSPISLVPISAPRVFQLIFELSYPRGSSLNSGINQEVFSFICTNFDEVFKTVFKEGKGSYLIKTDIKSAFCL